jgi:DNA-binding response OmpR family regulator
VVPGEAIAKSTAALNHVNHAPVMKPKILVVDDEPDALELVGFNLKRAGFEVMTAGDGPTALRKARELQPALIVLDVMLPDLDGLEVCKQLRSDPRTSATPVILLTARAAEVDRILGLELGADDYVTKPFSPRELVLRIRNVLGRRSDLGLSTDVLRIGQITVDPSRHQVEVRGQPVDLTATEFKLLTVLAQRRGRVQSREQLLRDVWEYDSMIDTRTVDTHVRRLREKLGPAADVIETVRGVGYRVPEA